MKLSERAKVYATDCHANTNHLYDAYPYSFHLAMVAETAALFLDETYSEEEKELILAACWAHDTIEDTRQTYNDVKDALNEEVAELVYALTNEKGKNRKERANAKYYEGIRNTEHAIFVKLCDRIANVTHSKRNKSRLFGLYQKENAHFCAQLGEVEKYEKLYQHLEKLFSEE